MYIHRRLHLIIRKNERRHVFFSILYIWPYLSKGHQAVKITIHCYYLLGSGK